MRKKILSGLFVLALLITAGYGVSENQKNEADLSDLALGSIEALARNEDGGITCSSSCSGAGMCWESFYEEDLGQYYCRFSGYQYDSCSC